MATNPLSLQMYTLRDLAATDYLGTLRKVKEIGYGAVEIAGFSGMSAAALRRELDAIGLVVSGAHVPIQMLESQLDAIIADMQTLGAPYLICPWMPPERRSSANDYRSLAQVLNSIGATASDAGLSFCYHHHDFELQPFGDTTGMHILLNECDPRCVAFEIDVYWAAYAGIDPVQLINEFAGRVPLVHLKDMTPGHRTFAEVGYGTLDIPAILQAARAAGAQWFVVEQDICQRPPLESVRMSYEYLKSLGAASA
ncbi:sugar phosphate isomerase/epimerase family protein [Roseiflexus sp.]|uniref:sugar phosphate isomerase/epimerase family protein n=1 Tax=Roseiflexus sp. TaxID=2562120 RepID=UPI00398B0176